MSTTFTHGWEYGRGEAVTIFTQHTYAAYSHNTECWVQSRAEILRLLWSISGSASKYYAYFENIAPVIVSNDCDLRNFALSSVRGNSWSSDHKVQSYIVSEKIHFFQVYSSDCIDNLLWIFLFEELQWYIDSTRAVWNWQKNAFCFLCNILSYKHKCARTHARTHKACLLQYTKHLWCDHLETILFHVHTTIMRCKHTHSVEYKRHINSYAVYSRFTRGVGTIFDETNSRNHSIWFQLLSFTMSLSNGRCENTQRCVRFVSLLFPLFHSICLNFEKKERYDRFILQGRNRTN